MVLSALVASCFYLMLPTGFDFPFPKGTLTSIDAKKLQIDPRPLKSCSSLISTNSSLV